MPWMLKPKKAARRRPGPPPTRYTNAQVVMTFASEAACEETTDPWDRAHRVMMSFGGLQPAAVERGGRVVWVLASARPRMYPPCYMVGPDGARVSFESAFERLDELQRALDLDRGGTMADAVYSALNRLAGERGTEAAVALTRGQTRQRDYWSGDRADRLTSAWLRSRGIDPRSL